MVQVPLFGDKAQTRTKPDTKKTKGLKQRAIKHKLLDRFHHVVDCPAINGHASRREKDSFLRSQRNDTAELHRWRDLIKEEPVQNERLSTQISQRVRLDRSSVSKKSINVNRTQSSRFLHAQQSSLKINEELEDENRLYQGKESRIEDREGESIEQRTTGTLIERNRENSGGEPAKTVKVSPLSGVSSRRRRR
ncbi:hypothetical protein HID58_000812 [Brassica napus]|uniref:Uncharacterized protein n=1 Tax=Brassica napus TaxID=3708 RepID=A0ABQ8EHU7_BRANA|nr:hypothetical protein HID58_000812 [Brassica napus]